MGKRKWKPMYGTTFKNKRNAKKYIKGAKKDKPKIRFRVVKRKRKIVRKNDPYGIEFR